ncbi:uncharacterized protein LACBIDRAFT_316659 [Laccaria bicolor S238N-H82]|uniref:Predicted protein n=1 Tax=Laccaria bicolor (strain S238N-H82 / ATCC MYA-4686) TaxID=486041 RepID=B0E1D1_LACBS|nr:uncharacterized protein LACBIDRAFT_316659 [Laccaria bicolor S238N-H82]EDQ99360.1 predicted protein [Laccaria bicolor S238N-H82]|eukprot:XP_001890006.1 predicted protein [Laccaria bicolor S238N-H82]
MLSFSTSAQQNFGSGLCYEVSARLRKIKGFEYGIQASSVVGGSKRLFFRFSRLA